MPWFEGRAGAVVKSNNEQQGDMTSRFVLFTTQRSGSTWTIDMLNSHPAVIAYSELFLEGGEGTPTWGGAKDVVFWNTHLARERAKSRETHARQILFEYLDSLYALRDGISSVGFKLMYGQAGAEPSLIDYMASRRVLVVHLIRTNYLDVLLSKETAVARDVFHSRTEAEVPQLAVILETSDLLRRLSRQAQEVQDAEALLARLSLPRIEIAYEDLLSGESSFNAVLTFLGVEPDAASLKSPLRKMNTRSHEELLVNYQDVRKTLQGTPFRNLLR